MLNTPRIGQPRCVEDANLEKILHILTTFKYTKAYRYAILAPKFIDVGLLDPTLILRTILLVAMVKGIEVVVIGTLALNDIGDEFHE